jgi:hypothetical protein
MSFATLTVAHSFALSGSSRSTSDPDFWTERTSFVWEPWLGKELSNTNGAFRFIGAGPTLGMRWDQLDDDSTRFGFAGGAWVSAGSMLQSDTSEGCGEDVRPYAALIIGIRGEELYASPKVGLAQVPEICFSLGGL